jgi:hypothetical protein
MVVPSNNTLFEGIGGDFGFSLGLNKVINKTQVRHMRANQNPWQQMSMNKENCRKLN